MGTRVFIPFGEFLPDRKLFGNEGLVRAFGVTPISGNYLKAPELNVFGAVSAASPLPGSPTFEPLQELTEAPFGMGTHRIVSSGSGKSYLYYGSETSLFEIDITTRPGDMAIAEVERSRATPYAFSASPPLASEMWWFTTFGENVVATNFEDEVQFLATPGTGLFANMITSPFKPQFRFLVPIRQNLFGFYAFLPATFDGIPAGTHPQLGAWSMNDNIQVFGSENVDPAHIGAGYQQFIGGDLGPITAAIGGDFGVVFQVGGIVRIDGPPYEFRTIVIGDTTLYPYSVFRVGDDVYFWGSGGPSVLRGGEGPVERLGARKMERSLNDNVTGFGGDFARAANPGARNISGVGDALNSLVRFAYDPKDGAYAGLDKQHADDTMPTLLFDHSELDTRSTISRSPSFFGTGKTPRTRFLRLLPQEDSQEWGPFGRVWFLQEEYSSGKWYPGYYKLGSTLGDFPTVELRTAFGRLSETHTTRIVAVRPVWSHTEGNTAAVEGAVEVQVHTKNKPWEDETDSSAHNVFNEDGWIGTDSTVVGTYHSITLKFLANTRALNEIHEIEGLEIEYVDGPAYGA